MNFNERVASRIRMYRNELGLKAEYVAYTFRMSKSAYSNLENGKTEITVDKLHLCAITFQKPITSFFGSEEGENAIVNI